MKEYPYTPVQEPDLAVENPAFWLYLRGMQMFHGYVSLP